MLKITHFTIEFTISIKSYFMVGNIEEMTKKLKLNPNKKDRGKYWIKLYLY